MQSVRQVVDSVVVGAQGTLRPPGTSVSDLEVFRADIAALESMQAEGVIEIVFRHQEDHTGRRYTDIVRFKRLR